jgi:hypothetical protein
MKWIALGLVLAATPAHAEKRGAIGGTVLWAGPMPSWIHCELCRSLCEVHYTPFDDVDVGLANVVLIAEPLSHKTQAQFRAHPRGPDEWADTRYHGPFGWARFIWEPDDPEIVGFAHPAAPLLVDSERELRFYRGDELLQTIEPGEEIRVTLPEGIIKVVDDHDRVGWVYVTPYPAQVSGGNCRFMFTELPPGRYRLRGWHPRGGARSLIVDVSAGRFAVFRFVTFGKGRAVKNAIRAWKQREDAPGEP